MMKKTFLLLAAALLAGVAFADSYTLSFHENTGDTSKDSSGLYNKEVAHVFGTTEYVTSIDNRDAIYPARKDCGAKFGSSSKKGLIAFTLTTPTLVDSIVVSAAMYGISEGGDGFLLINVAVTDTATFGLSAGNKVFENCTWTPTDTVKTIRIQQKTVGQRIYVKSITVYPKSGKTTVLEQTPANTEERKFFRNGHLYIRKDNRTFSASGAQLH